MSTHLNNVKKTVLGLFSESELKTLKASKTNQCQRCEQDIPLAKLSCCSKWLCRDCTDSLFDHYNDTMKDRDGLFICPECNRVCMNMNYDY